MQQLRAAFCVFLLLAVVTGLVYPGVVTAIAQAIFNHRANGSVIERNGKPIGSELIGQKFDADSDPQGRYFWSRRSATTPAYNGGSSSGQNWGVTNPDLTTEIDKRIAAMKKAHPDQKDRPVPIDLVTASASGLDPHISPAAAEYQAQRVADKRGLSVDVVRELIAKHTQGRTLGLLGEPRVNVLPLNLALDALRVKGG